MHTSLLEGTDPSCKLLSFRAPPSRLSSVLIALHTFHSDLTDDATNQKLILDFYESKKPTASVCHGPTVFVNIKDSNGERFVKGKKVSFSFFSRQTSPLASLEIDDFRLFLGHLLL